MSRRMDAWAIAGLTTVLSLSLSPGPAAAGSVPPAAQRASGDSHSYEGGVSADGRYVVFSSWASNLVAGDTNQTQDVFVRDMVAGTTRRVSVGVGGQGDQASLSPTVSSDGRYVAFASAADNLVTGDSNATWDVFVRDLVGGTTQRVSVGTGGGQGDKMSFDPAISADGQSVAFTSAADNLVTGDSNSEWDVFVRSWSGGTTRLASATAGGAPGDNLSYDPSISASGRYVAFVSGADNLVAPDTNVAGDIFVRDLTTGAIDLVSVATGGARADAPSVSPQVTPDGRYVAFTSLASTLASGDTNVAPDAFVRDRTLGTTRRVDTTSAGGQANGEAFTPFLSDDGRYATFASTATDLVTPSGTQADAQVYSRDLTTGAYRQASLSTTGQGGNLPAKATAASPDGRYIAYETASTNLDPTDANQRFDIFVWDRQTGASRRASLGDGPAARTPGRPGRPEQQPRLARPGGAAPRPGGAAADLADPAGAGTTAVAAPVQPHIWVHVVRIIIVLGWEIIVDGLVWIADRACSYWDAFTGWVGRQL